MHRSAHWVCDIVYTRDDAKDTPPIINQIRRSAWQQGALSVKRKIMKHQIFSYGNKKWKKKRERILRLDGYMDRIEKRYGRLVPATIVHHIYPAEEYPEYAWEDWNLISVSMATHNKLENRESGGLTEEGIKLMRRTKPGEDWRKRS